MLLILLAKFRFRDADATVDYLTQRVSCYAQKEHKKKCSEHESLRKVYVKLQEECKNVRRVLEERDELIQVTVVQGILTYRRYTQREFKFSALLKAYDGNYTENSKKITFRINIIVRAVLPGVIYRSICWNSIF